MQPLSDEHLVKSTLSGNLKHFRLLYERYKDYVASIARNMLANEELARDLTQETFLRVFKGLKKFKGKSSFKTWLTRIAVNICKDHLRSGARRHEKYHVSVDDPENKGIKELLAKAHAADPQSQLLQKERKEVVESAMNKLSKEHNMAITLWKEGLSYAEMAEIMNIPVGTVGRLIYDAKMILKDLLKPYVKRIRPMKIECENFGPTLSAYLDGELPDKERQEVEKHLKTCQTCQQQVQTLEEAGDIIKEALSPEAIPKVDLTGVWEEIEAQVHFGPSLWQRIKGLIERPVVWMPTAVATAAVVLLVILLPLRSGNTPMELSKVESVYSATGQVMVLQTPKNGRPLIWILPGPGKEVGS